jgi:hypothetical protein
MSSTWELLQEAHRLMVDLESDNGELSDDAMTRIDSFLEGAGDKVGAIRHVIDRLSSEEDHHKKMRDRHRKRLGTLANAKDRLNGYAMQLLQAKEELGEEAKASGEWGRAWVLISQSIEVSDPEKVPVQDLKEQPPKVDKTAAKKRMKETNEAIPGFTLTTNQSVQWR